MQERSTGMLCYSDWVSALSIIRPGYLFCKELLPQNHDLQLMLVNTIRKVRFSTTLVFLDLKLDSARTWRVDQCLA
jgi:hypothetical protein